MNINANQIKHLKFQKIKDEYVVSLIDLQDYEILKGYGITIEEAINDLHNNLL